MCVSDSLVLCDENGTNLEKTASREETHKNGYWHRTAHIWLIDFEGLILLQLRSFEKDIFPNRWDVSAAGHLDLGETPVQAARRELREELGIDVAENDLEFLGDLKCVAEITSPIKTKIRKRKIAILDREIQSVFLVRISHYPINKFNLQKSEVQKVKWFSVEELQTALKERAEEFVPHNEEWLLVSQRLNRV
ncbi:hypothetical protein AGMMS49938_15890 [Fibrobacterales bacterium]|nr:hypothetical protein AGMMS49938_15890 [Fibrobacterales bacterium]